MKKLTGSLVLLFFLGQGILVNAQSSRSFIRRANDQFEMKAFSEAILNYQEVLSRKSDDPEALEKIALSYANLNQMDQASDYMTKLVRQRISEPSVLVAYGQILRSQGRYEEAKTYFAQYARTNRIEGDQLVRSCDFAISQQYLRGAYTVVEDRINSPAADFGPAFYQNQVVYASSRTDVTRVNSGWDGIAYSQLFKSAIGMDGYLQQPSQFNAAKQNQGIGPVSFTQDGKLVAFTKNNFVSGVRQIPDNFPELNIFFAELSVEGNWVNEQSFIHNNGKTGYPSLTPDGNSLYFAAELPGGYGGMDIYVSVRDGNSWAKPINLGAKINTAGDEISPYWEGETLYFASDYHEGFGGMDIFAVEVVNGKWGNITNLGLPVNSSRDDYGFIWNPLRNLGFFVSNRGGGRGAEDIYHVQKGGVSASVPSEVVLRILDASTRQPISGATIDLSACMGASKLVYSDYKGEYMVPSINSGSCQVNITLSGYEPQLVQLTTGNQSMEVLMSRAGTSYFGTVIDLASSNGIPGAEIQARNFSNNQVIRAVSDRYGEYSLPLSANTTYQLNYAATGYNETSKTISTFSETGRGVLGMVALSRITGTLPDPTISNGYQPITNNPVRGFGIQVAAMGKTPELGNYAKLNAVGNVYVVNERGMYKVRVGPYTTLEEAKATIARVRSLGYTGAYAVEELGQSLVSPTNSNVQVVERIQQQPTSIMIQLGAYSNPANFDGSKVSLIGPVVDRKKGNLTIKLITGFRTVEEARQQLQSVRNAGFVGAFVVREENGVLTRVP